MLNARNHQENAEVKIHKQAENVRKKIKLALTKYLDG
jgi:hypothetical protein